MSVCERLFLLLLLFFLFFLLHLQPHAALGDLSLSVESVSRFGLAVRR